MMSEPQKQHHWLQKFVGYWTMDGECQMGPDTPPMKQKGTETVRSIGGLWVVCEGQGEMPNGNPCTMLMTLGYDPKTGRYVGTWIGSMMTHLWIYDGELDSAAKILTLSAEGPDMAVEGKLGKYRDVIEFKTDDHRILTSHMLGEDGKWQQFMTAHYRRSK